MLTLGCIIDLWVHIIHVLSGSDDTVEEVRENLICKAMLYLNQVHTIIRYILFCGSTYTLFEL